jgi:TM2 domain-containing membrane protein YozV
MLSLLMPGLGQIYCGARIRGLATLGCFILSVIGAVFIHGEFRWLAARFAVMLYAFAPFDAYETARDHNAGIEADASDNPRVAALLNLTTNGFGYVYLGNQLGFGVFILMYTFGRAVAGKLPLVAEVFVALLAIHAWRIAQRNRNETYKPELRPPMPEAAVPRAVPVFVSLLILVCYYAVLTVGQIALLKTL